MNKEKNPVKSYLPFLTSIFVFFISCSTPLEKITYLDGIEPFTRYKQSPLPEDYRVRPNDHLYIRVIGVNPENVAFLNIVGSQTTSAGLGSNMELITYLVDEDGNINYPFLGKINVENKTVTEIQEMLQKEVDNYLQNSSVFVKLVGRTITVLGEVDRPGQITMLKSRITIFEALGMAGDITDYGNRQNVKLIRELPKGKYIAALDLTDPDLIHSSYYYILPHDILYVENRTRIYGAKNLSYTAPLGIAASLVSLGLLILNLFQ